MGERDCDKIVDACLKRWGDPDKRTKHFLDSFDTWIKSIPENATEMILQLLSGFCYYSHQVVNQYLMEVHQRLIKPGEITDDNTIYISIKTKTGIANSSNVYWVEYKLQNDINRYICIDDIRKMNAEQLACILNVVIIDDCSGSGSTLTRYLEENFDLFSGKNIYFITIHVMKEALNNIKKFALEKKMVINTLYMFEQDKAFNSKYFEEQSSMRNLFGEISRTLKIHKEHIWGFEKSEGLFAFYNNTPNNTLGLFRYDTDEYSSPFPRKNDEKPDWWGLRAQKKEREKQNYYSAMEQNK